MANLGFFELTLFGIIALIVLGPEKLPLAARTLGKWYGKFRRMSARLQSEFVSEMQLLEVQEELKAELAKIKESEAAMKQQVVKLQRTIDQTEQTAHTNKHHILESWQTSTNDDESPIHHHNAQKTAVLETAFNMPMVNRWFLLSEYDKKRRLPPPPFLPNHQADKLLHQGGA